MSLIKVLDWSIALLGLWEFGDITALFLPGFGDIPTFLWNHIIVGMILMIVGVWAARTSNAGTVRALNWVAACIGVWLMISSLILRYPVINAGLWNDIFVGLIVLIFGGWVALNRRG